LGLLRQALVNGYRGRFYNAQDLIDELYASLADHSSTRLLKRLSAYDVLVIDELGYLTLQPEQVNAFFKLLDQRYGRKSTLITTNLAYEEWYQLFQRKGSLNNNYPFWPADPSRPTALRKGLHTTSMRPFARLAGRAPRRPKSLVIIEQALRVAGVDRGRRGWLWSSCSRRQPQTTARYRLWREPAHRQQPQRRGPATQAPGRDPHSGLKPPR